MMLIVFRSRMSDQVDGEYDSTQEYLAGKVREMAGDDLVQLKSYVSEEDSEHVVLVWWRNPETLVKWRNDPEHQNAQKLGREKWYSFYELTIADVARTSSIEADAPYPAP